jgi:hypothetical protein
VPSWDPIAHTFPQAMAIYKTVFDPPLTLIPVTSVATQMATAFTTTLMAKDLMPESCHR